METFINILIWAFIIFGVVKKAKSSSKEASKKESSSPVKPKQKKKSRQKQEDVITQRLKRRYEPDQVPAEDVFTRAKNNTCADTKNTPVSQTTMTSSVFSVKSEDLMKQVEDLIVLGYEAKLPFERDFIAEGNDLISKY